MAFGNSIVVQLVAGMAHTCAILNDNSVKCWGANVTSQLGLDDRDERSFPETVTELGSNVRSLAAGRGHTCAILNAEW